MMLSYVNPYSGNSFFEFFQTLFLRLWEFLSGSQIQMNLVSDELQIIVLTLISISSALVGTFLVLRKMSMLANALSHTILPGVVLAYLIWSWMHRSHDVFDAEHLLPSDTLLFFSALLMAFFTTFLTEFLVSHMGIKEDASTGIVFTFLFSLGILLVTVLTRNAHIGIELLMGNVDALHTDDMVFGLYAVGLNFCITICLFRGLVITTFDPVFSKVAGFSVQGFGYVLMAELALSSIGAFRAVGVLLLLAFLVGPCLIARLWTHHVKTLILVSASIGVFASILGVALARHLLSDFAMPVSTSSLVVIIIALIYAFALMLRSFSDASFRRPILKNLKKYENSHHT